MSNPKNVTEKMNKEIRALVSIDVKLYMVKI